MTDTNCLVHQNHISRQSQSRAGQEPLCAEPSGVASCHPGEGAEASHLNTSLPSTVQARAAGSMLKAGIFSEACNVLANAMRKQKG